VAIGQMRHDLSPDYSLAAWALAPVERFLLPEPDASAIRLINTLYFHDFLQSIVHQQVTLISFNLMNNPG
jgi:hypothetical protein